LDTALFTCVSANPASSSEYYVHCTVMTTSVCHFMAKPKGSSSIYDFIPLPIIYC